MNHPSIVLCCAVLCCVVQAKSVLLLWNVTVWETNIWLFQLGSWWRKTTYFVWLFFYVCSFCDIRIKTWFLRPAPYPNLATSRKNPVD